MFCLSLLFDDQGIRDFLIRSPLILLFLVISIGYMLGEIRWWGGFRLGIAAVLFVGLGFGMWDTRFEIPSILSSIGLVLFLYCVGLESGPGFFQNFKLKGFSSIVALFFALIVSMSVCWGMMQTFTIDPYLWVGVFCGALTNTPALASATETLKNLGEGERVDLLIQGYGIAYPIAIITVLLMIQWIMIWRKSKSISGQGAHFIYPAKTLQILNFPNGVSDWTPEMIEKEFSINVTRYQTMAGKLILVTDHKMPMDIGSYFIAVGTPENIRNAADAVGRMADIDLVQDMQGFELHRYHVSNPDVVEIPIRELKLEKWGAMITRLRRGDIDLNVTPETVLQLGDRVRVLSLNETEASVRKLFGNSMIQLSEMGYASFGIGIVLGVLLGQIPLPIPGFQESIHLGSAGGVLLAGLWLGSRGRTGKLVWLIPQSNNLALRQLGILFFLSTVGIQAGKGFLQTIQDHGLTLIIPVMMIALSGHLILCFVLRRMGFRDPEMWVGSCCGLQTQPAALAFASEKMDRGPLALAYATLFPMALLLKVIIAQVFVYLLHQPL